MQNFGFFAFRNFKNILELKMIEKYLFAKYIRKYFYIFLIAICIKFSSNENLPSRNRTFVSMLNNERYKDLSSNNKSLNTSGDKLMEKVVTLANNLSLDKPDFFRQKILLQMSKIGRNNSQDFNLNKKSNRKSHENNANKVVKTKKGVKHIDAIYNIFKNGKYVYDDPQINTIRFIPSIKGNLFILN